MRVIRLVFLTAIAVIVILASLRFLETLSLDKFRKSRPDVKIVNAESPSGEDIDTGKFPSGFDGAKWGMTLKEVMEIAQKEGKKLDTSSSYYFSNIGELYSDLSDSICSSFDKEQDNFVKLIGVKISWGRLQEEKEEKLRKSLIEKYGHPSKEYPISSTTTDFYVQIWYYPNYTYGGYKHTLFEDGFEEFPGAAIVLESAGVAENERLRLSAHRETRLVYLAPPLLYQKLRKSYEEWESETLREYKEKKEREFKERF